MTVLKVAKSGEQEAEFRQFLSYLFAQSSAGIATDGVLAGLAVTPTSTPSGSVQVDVGAALAQDSRLAGAFPLLNNAPFTLDVLTNNLVGSVPRNDIVVIDYATESIRAIIGEANASPEDPTIPPTAVALYRLRQIQTGQPGAGTIPASRMDDLRVGTSLFARPDSADGIKVKRTEIRSLLSSWNKAVPAAGVVNVQWATPDTNTLGLVQTDAATLTVPAGLGGLFLVSVDFAFTSSADERRFVELFTTNSVMNHRDSFRSDGFGHVSTQIYLPDGAGMRAQCYAQTAAVASAGHWQITRLGK